MKKHRPRRVFFESRSTLPAMEPQQCFSEASYQAIVETQTELICRFKPDSRLTYVNEACCRYFQKPRQELLGRRFLELISEKSREQVQARFSSLTPDNPIITYTSQVWAPDGSIQWQQWTNLAIFSAQGRLIEYQSVGYDVTRLKQVEAELRESKAELECRIQERTAELTRINETLVKEIAERDRTEKVLRENEQRLRLITSNMLDMIGQIDPKGFLQYISPSVKNILGYEPEKITGLSIVPLIHPDDFNAGLLAQFKEMLQGSTSKVRVRLRHVAGHYVWVECNSNGLVNENEVMGVIFASRDISQQKQIEEALKKSEQRLADIINFLPDATVAIDTLGKVIVWNRAAEQMTGLMAPEVLGKGEFEYAVPFHGARKPVLIDLALKADESLEKEYRSIKWDSDCVIGERFCPGLGPSGRYVWGKASRLFDSNSICVGAIESIRDITDQEQIFNALYKSEEKYRNLFNTMAQGVIYHNETGRIVSLNPAAEQILGVRCQEIHNLNQKITLIEEDGTVIPVENWPSQQALKTGNRVKNEIRGIIGPDGRNIRWVMINATPRFKEGMSEPCQVYTTLTDITQLKQAEYALGKSLIMARSALEGTVLALASIAEKRDPYTAGHQRRVTQLAQAIGREMQLAGEEQEALYIASMLHDIGKINVPAEILSKPGKLSCGEWIIIKGHVEVGSDIVKKIPFDKPVAQIILQHHERLDGSGYPYCLSGDHILPEARILAVADVVEAMASHRPYRPAHSLDKALEEITEKRGILYDPQVVDACLSIIDHGFHFT